LQEGKHCIPGEDIETIASDLKVVVAVAMKNTSFFQKSCKEKSFMSRWNFMLEHPDLYSLRRLPTTVIRLGVAANSEAGCEQSNSKYNRAKNKYSTNMKLPMITVFSFYNLKTTVRQG